MDDQKDTSDLSIDDRFYLLLHKKNHEQDRICQAKG